MTKNNGEINEGEAGIRSHWTVVAETVSRIEAEFAVNGLKAYDIPAVLDARPGFLGTAGLALRSLKDGKMETFKIKVPAEYASEASDVVGLFISDISEKGKE